MLIGITGGTGFIGKTLVLRHLVAGDRVRLLTRQSSYGMSLPNSVQIFHGDLTGPVKSLIPFVDGVDVFYHCAGEIRNEAKMYSVHVRGTKNLCVAADRRIRHWVQLSSVGVYGLRYCGIVTEETPLRPMSTYEMTKAESDQIVIDTATRGGFTYSILRPCKVLGFGMMDQSLFQMMSFINKGLFFFIGKPGASANYVHVDNVIEGLVRCGKMSAARGQIYNLSDHRTIEEFVQAISDYLGRPVPRFRLPKMPVWLVARLCGKLPNFPLTESRVKSLTSRVIYSIERIQSELGYVNQVSIEDGLRQMVKIWEQSK